MFVCILLLIVVITVEEQKHPKYSIRCNNSDSFGVFFFFLTVISNISLVFHCGVVTFH